MKQKAYICWILWERNPFSFLLHLKVWGCISKTWKYCHDLVLLLLKASRKRPFHSKQNRKANPSTSCLLKSPRLQVTSHRYFVRNFEAGLVGFPVTIEIRWCSLVQHLSIFLSSCSSSKKYLSLCHHDVLVVVISPKGFLLHVTLITVFYSPSFLF